MKRKFEQKDIRIKNQLLLNEDVLATGAFVDRPTGLSSIGIFWASVLGLLNS